MSDKIKVNIIITTYDSGNGARFNLLYQTTQALVDNLQYPNLGFVITDDGSPNHYDMVREVSEIISEDDVIFYDTGRRGVGYAKNHALQDAFKTSPIVLLLEDDWVLREPLNLLPHIQLMLDHPEVACIRLGFLGGDMLARLVDYGYPLTYWELQKNSGLYIYSGQISIRSHELYKQVGWHREGVPPGEEELDYCHRYNNTEHNLKTLWPAQYGITLNSGPFINIGIGNSLNGIAPEIK